MSVTTIIIMLSCALFGGIAAGMGMGGGTLLIPLLTVFCAVNQHSAQGLNLVAFVPMSVIVIIIHAKNKLLKPKYFLTVSLPAALAAVGASLLAKLVTAQNLKLYFGIFLAILGIYQLTTLIINGIKNKRQKLMQN